MLLFPPTSHTFACAVSSHLANRPLCVAFPLNSHIVLGISEDIYARRGQLLHCGQLAVEMFGHHRALWLLLSLIHSHPLSLRRNVQ